MPPAAGDQRFYNAVAIVESALDPWSMLVVTQRLEAAAGRAPAGRRGHNAPRPLDIDILYAGGWSSRDERLTVPHPRLDGRGFALVPLAELRPELRLPGWTCTVAERVAQLGRRGLLHGLERVGTLGAGGLR